MSTDLIINLQLVLGPSLSDKLGTASRSLADFGQPIIR